MKYNHTNCKPSESWLIDDRYDGPELETTEHEVYYAGMSARLTVQHDPDEKLSPYKVIKVVYWIPTKLAKELHAITYITDELVMAVSGSDEVDGMKLSVGDVWVCGEES